MFFAMPVFSLQNQSVGHLLDYVLAQDLFLHLENTSWPSVWEATCKIFTNMHTVFENQYAGVMLAVLGIERVPMLSL